MLRLEKEQKNELIKIIISAAIFAVGIALKALLTDLPWYVFAALFAAAYLVCGFDVLKEAVENALHGEFFDEDFLMCVASVGAFVLGEYPEGAAVMILFKVGELFEDIAVGRSRKSVTALLEIRPDSAAVLRGGKEVAVRPEEVTAGEVIVIRAGERVPLDGVIEDGRTDVDTSALTGESMPVSLCAGDNILAGSVNKSGTVRVRVCGSYGESTVARILKLVEESASRKAKAESFIRRFAKIYTPCVTVAALLLGVGVPLIFGGEWGVWIKRALTFLVVSCPCALVISVPLAFFGGIGGASRKGILVKGSESLEALSKVKTAVFDKTGTLTKGAFSVTCVHPDSVSEAELLDIAALAESYSSHPIARSIIEAHGGHIEADRVSDVTECAGKGVIATVDDRRVCVGSTALMESEGAEWKECHHAGTVAHISVDGVYEGHIVISDELKDDSAAAISALKKLGVGRTVILTGDSEAVASDTAKAIGADEYSAHLLPDGKVDEIEKLMQGGDKVLFVGDGINDAPVIMRADVGVAMGALGSDAAIEAADVVLTDDKPSKVAKAISIARKTLRIARENIVFSIAVKVAVLALAALGIASMWIAVFADVGVMILAVLNSLRTMRG